MKKKEDIYYEAMLARDHRFDGKFFIGVKTTDIYCRPICPAKPKRENVEFFENRFQAEKKGYRPCLRCRPESAPLSPVWIGTSAIVQRALKLLNDEAFFDLDENLFAQKFGVSARHLRRLFKDEIGKTPKQIAYENRLILARKLIVETSLPLSEVAFSSGFLSVRRFNDAFKDRFKKQPGLMRKNKKNLDQILKVTLPYRPPFDFEGLYESYKNHRIENLEWFENGKMERVIVESGKVGTIIIENDEKNSCLVLSINFPETKSLYSIIAKVRRLFDIDSDPVMIANAIDKDSKLKKLLKKSPGVRLPSGWDSFEIAISTILGQLVTIEFGRTLVRDLIENLGEISTLEKDGKPLKLFPAPRAIANSDLSFLRTTRKRKETLQNFARAIDNGELSLEEAQDVDQFMKKVMNIKGIGPWSASYMALKCLRHTDAFPYTDLILARAIEKYDLDGLEKMAPWRGYVAILLWKNYAKTLNKRTGYVRKK